MNAKIRMKELSGKEYNIEVIRITEASLSQDNLNKVDIKASISTGSVEGVAKTQDLLNALISYINS